MDTFFKQLVNGLSLGSIYALIALGYTMVYGIVKLINFAHGDVMMIGAYTGYFVLTATGPTPLGLVLAFLGAMVVCAVLSIAIERCAYRPLRAAPRLNSLITAIAVELILQNAMRVLPFVGPNPRQFPTMETKFFYIWFSTDKQYSADCNYFFSSFNGYFELYNQLYKNRTCYARCKLRSWSRKLMGVNVNRTIAITFVIGSVLAGAGGVLYATAYPQVDPFMGYIPGLKAFVAAVLGGIGSIPGAMVGGVILGIAETMTKAYISSQYADAISYCILIVILLVKPAGLLGKKEVVKV